MKKIVKTFLCMLLCLTAVTCAYGAECAGKVVDHESLKYYPSYTCDAETGKWSVQPYQADGLVDRFWDYGMRSSQRMVVFHLAAEGDARTGVWTPVLRFYHIDGVMINARAVSIMANGQRFDLSASSETVVHSQHTAECITAPLNKQSLEVIAAMQQADTVVIRLHGEETYTVTVERGARSECYAVEAASLEVIESGLQLFKELGVESYDLWDLSAKAWEMEYGYQPNVTEGSLGDRLCEKRITDRMSMVLPETTGEAAVAAQQKLIEYGFLNGAAYWKVTDEAVNATLRAQKVLGRVPTGCADAALLDALAEGRKMEKKIAPAMQSIGDKAELCVNRYWFAKGVSASANAESLRTTANADNVFLIADGLLRNLDVEELQLFMQMEAKLVCNSKYVYEAELAVECSGETEFDTRLLPLAQARMVAYAEIPSALGADENAQWSIVFELDGESLTIELE